MPKGAKSLQLKEVGPRFELRLYQVQNYFELEPKTHFMLDVCLIVLLLSDQAWNSGPSGSRKRMGYSALHELSKET